MIWLRESFPSAKLQKIADYGNCLVEASLAAPEPPSKYGMLRYYKFVHPGEAAQLLRLIWHYVASRYQYRGAAHMASWESYTIKGYAWSAFTSIWRNEANTFDALHKEMGTSVFTREEILEALRNLKQRGWIEEHEARYHVTALEGKRIREDAETFTDKYFFAPWSCLSESELEELASLAGQLRDGLKAGEQK